MPDLYAELGVPRDADTATIRKAYRKASKRAHPDGGGSPEKFRSVSRALEVLSDPQRRKTYDETGNIEDKPIDNTQAELMLIVNSAIDAVFGDLEQRRIEFEAADIVARATQILRQRKSELTGQVRTLDAAIKKVRKIESRFKPKKGKVNRLGPMMAGRIASMESNRQRTQRQLDQIIAAIAVLDDHTFEVREEDRRNGYVSGVGQGPFIHWDTT